MRAGYGISYDFFNRVGSAQEGINAPQALFGVLNQSIPAGGPVPADVPDHAEQLHHGHRQSVELQSADFERRLHLRRTRGGPTSNRGSSRCSERFSRTRSWNWRTTATTVPRLPIIADYNQAYPNLPGQTLGVQARRPIPSLRPDHVGGSRGQSTIYNGFSARLEHRFSRGLYFLNSFTWSKALGDSEQALEYFAGYYRSQSAEHP